MIKKVYFLTSEIMPFAETYSLSTFSKEVPVVFNERKYDFRVMMPKYDFISERRYILREVIRLRDMELKFQGHSTRASVKSAFIPNTKVQVYFLEHDKYYDSISTALYEPKSYPNSIRFGYFAFAALTTLSYLRWKPEVIICNDWQMSLVPLIIHSNLLDKEYFEGVKILQIVHSKSPLSLYTLSEYEDIGLKDLDPSFARDEKVDCLAYSVALSDKVLVLNSDGDLMKKYRNDPHFSDIFKKYDTKIFSYDLKSESPEEWQKLADEIIEIVEKS
jgi:starch synthase